MRGERDIGPGWRAIPYEANNRIAMPTTLHTRESTTEADRMIEKAGELPDPAYRRDEKEGRKGGNEISDTELFDRFLSGEDGAFLELFDRHAQRIGRYCYRLIGDSDRAQDIVQDVWEKLVRFRDGGENAIRNPLGLIYTIARNLSLNHIRNRRGHIPLHTLHEDDHPLHEQRELSRHEEMAILALERLPLSQREILILNAYSDYNFEEIARMMGESHGSIRTKAWRGRQQLRRIIAAMIEFDENYIDGDRENQ